MKKMVKLMSTTLLFSLMAHSIQVAAEETFPKEYNSEGIITFEAGDEEVTPPVDPENPDPTDPVDPVDPPGPGTGGALSIDYGSKFKFGVQKISTADKVYYAAPDEMTDGSKKPTYVQVTDKRGTLAGWKLSLSQPEQFKTASGEELVGAQLAFTKGQAASLVDAKYTPTTVNADLILTPGASNTLAINAKEGTGVGTWVYRFGANEEENKDAVQLSVPGKSVKLAKQYSTKLVWSLENTPNN
ncbi:cell surface protein [Enterococcus thailandicus]|uniref:Cell surface protein n=1 Tax=Enterococcus thailandicus TaxID=417368 RepID=A0A249SHB2_ENTTH|nr:WxL domain-containing protein [Enterococcus thailandicus]ASZ07010.1 WxL domain-containing protein [Enterococcus thailandicus]GEK35718.1 cell surface protein [Enterococcus thailandicus]GMC03779.1 cell surface protein [Enterococcus thailandicus]GMC09704.1 cell surface protein [Enterococcus thailandicus]